MSGKRVLPRAVQALRFCASAVGRMGLIPGQRTKIPPASRYGQKKKKGVSKGSGSPFTLKRRGSSVRDYRGKTRLLELVTGEQMLVMAPRGRREWQRLAERKCQLTLRLRHKKEIQNNLVRKTAISGLKADVK